jgi:predicted nucleic acid-binding protein
VRLFLADVLAPLWRLMPSPALYARGLELQERHALGFYDALIVAAAIEGGCTRLWSEDMQDGLRINRLTIRNPFAELSV